MHHENETLKKIIEESEELQKCQNQLKNQVTSADRKMMIKNYAKRYRIWWRQIEILFGTQQNKKRHYDYDYYSDETDIESEDENTNNEDSDDEIIIKMKKNIKKKNARKPPAKKQKKKQKGLTDYINS